MTKPIFEKVLIEEAVSEGNCLARVDNQVIFVKGAAPGDVMDLEITRKKKNYLEAVPHKIHSYSTAREEPFCSHFGSCGGCKWQHIKYDEQLKLKYKQVVDNLTRIGQISFPPPKPILPAPLTTFYRNKLEFSFSTKRWLSPQEISSGEVFDQGALGFHAPGLFSKVVDIDTCYLQKDPSNQIRQKIKEYALKHNLSYLDFQYEEGAGTGPIATNLTWQTRCVHLSENFGSNTFEFKFLVTEKGVCFPKADTLTVIVEVGDIENSDELEVPPNVFTPNGDGLNETFSLPNLPKDNCSTQFKSFRVFNRWGKLVFEGRNRDFNWDGGSNPSGVYYYYLDYNTFSYNGILSIIR